LEGEVPRYRFSAALEKDADGYFAFCPELQGCCTQGETYEEALARLRDAIRLHVEDRLDAAEEIPQPDSVREAADIDEALRYAASFAEDEIIELTG
jgi:predicted RNase H-like HicB family nuclease